MALFGFGQALYNAYAALLAKFPLHTADIFTGGQINKSDLEYTLAADQTGVSLTANAWTNVFATQTFTIDDASSLIEVYVRGVVNVQCATAGAQCATRVITQNVNTFGPIGGGVISIANGWQNALSGCGMVPITNLGVGSGWQIQVQVMCTQTALFNCRPATFPGAEGIGMSVRERKR